MAEHPLGPLQGPLLPGGDDHLDPTVPLPQSSPEATVSGAPGAQGRGGLVSRIGVDEDGPVRFQCDRQLEPEVLPGLPHRSRVHPQGKVPSFDPERLEGTELLRLGRQPGQAGMLQHIVERKQAREENFRRSGKNRGRC